MDVNKYRVWLVPIIIFMIGGYAVVLDYKIKKQSKEFHQELENYKNKIDMEIEHSFNVVSVHANSLNGKLDEVSALMDSTIQNKDSIPNQVLNNNTFPENLILY